jgi:hypothetical protein
LSETITQEALYQMQQESWNRYVLECKELLVNLQHLLKGEIKQSRYVEYGGETIEVEEWSRPPGQSPPINEEGFYHTILTISGLLDKSMATGNLSEEQACILVRQNMKSLTNVYTVRFKDFQFKSISEASSLISVLTAQVMTHFTKSIQMGLIKQLASQYSISEQKVTGLPKQEAGLSM